MRNEHQPLYMIGVAASLCGVHPQTLRQYERLGLISPARLGDKNRLYSEHDIVQVKRIQRLTQGMGVNLAGVEVILRILEQFEEFKTDMETQFQEYIEEAETRISNMMQAPTVPLKKNERLLPVPNFKPRTKIDI